jgi:hypothetical protein
MPSYLSVVFPYMNDASRGIKYVLPLNSMGFIVLENEGRWVWDDKNTELYDTHKYSYYTGSILSANALSRVKIEYASYV